MATIIDAFLVTLGLDKKDFQAGAKDAEKSTEDLKNKVKETADSIKENTAAMGEGFLKFAERAAVLIGVGLSLHELKQAIRETAEEYVNLAKLAEQFHTTTEALDEFADSGKLIGLSNDVTIGSLKNLDRAVQDTALGIGRAQVIFEELKISVKDASGAVKPTTQVMGELAQKFQGMERGKQLRIMERLGLDPGLLKLFNADLAALAARTEAIDKSTGFNLAEAVMNSKEFMKSIKGVQLEINTLKMFFEKLFEAGYVRIMPYITSLMDEAKDILADVVTFVEDHKDFVVGVFIAMGAAIAYFLLPQLIAAATATLAAIGPWLLMGAAIAAVIAVFALLYEDWQVWLNGGTSALGEFYQFFADVWNKIAPTVTRILGEIAAIFESVFNLLGDMIAVFVALFSGDAESIKNAFKMLGSDLVALWIAAWDLLIDVSAMAVQGFIALLAALYEGLWALLKEGAAAFVGWLAGRWAVVGDLFAGVVNSITGIWNDLWSGMRNTAANVLDWLSDKLGVVTGLFKSIGSAISAVTSGAISTTVNTNAGAPIESALAAASPANAANSIAPSIANNSNSQSSNVSKEVHIGEINVHTAATDAQGIASAVGPALRSESLVDHADGGF